MGDPRPVLRRTVGFRIWGFLQLHVYLPHTHPCSPGAPASHVLHTQDPSSYIPRHHGRCGAPQRTNESLPPQNAGSDTAGLKTTSQEIGRRSDRRRTKQAMEWGWDETGVWEAPRYHQEWPRDRDTPTEACCGEGQGPGPGSRGNSQASRWRGGRGWAEKCQGMAFSGTGTEGAGRPSWSSSRAPELPQTLTPLCHTAHLPAMLFSFPSGFLTLIPHASSAPKEGHSLLPARWPIFSAR